MDMPGYNPLVAFWGQMIARGLSPEAAVEAFRRRRLARDLDEAHLLGAAQAAASGPRGEDDLVRCFVLLRAAEECADLDVHSRVAAILAAAESLATQGCTDLAQRVLRQAQGLVPRKTHPHLTASLAASLGGILLRAEEYAQAEQPLSQALSLYRKLARQDPAGFGEELAETVFSLGVSRAERGRREDAAAVLEEALALYRRLAVEDPCLRRDVARVQSYRGGVLLEQGDLPAARAAYEEALGLLRSPEAEATAQHGETLGTLLCAYADVLARLGETAAARAVCEDATAVLRRLWQGERDTDESWAAVLRELLPVLAEVDPAGVTALEAEIRAEALSLAATGTPEGSCDGVALLFGLGVQQRAQERLGQSRESLEAAVGLARRTPPDDPAGAATLVAAVLGELATTCLELGDSAAARAAFAETITLLRPLAADDPQLYLPLLADNLCELSAALRGLPDREALRAHLTETIGLLRALVDGGRGDYRGKLATVLCLLAQAEVEADDHEAARAAYEEAVALQRVLVDASRETHGGRLATILCGLASTLVAVGEAAAAQDVATEALALCREVPAGPPFPQAVSALGVREVLSGVLCSVGLADEGRQLADEATAFGAGIAAATEAAGLHQEAETMRAWLAAREAAHADQASEG